MVLEKSAYLRSHLGNGLPKIHLEVSEVNRTNRDQLIYRVDRRASALRPDFLFWHDADFATVRFSLSHREHDIRDLDDAPQA